MYRSFLALILLLTLVLSFSGEYLWVSIKKISIKKSVKQRMIIDQEDDLLVLHFSSNEAASLLKWEHDEEFEYNGEMYDVISIKEYNDSISYCVWHDHDESALNKELETICKSIFGSTAHQNELANLILKLRGLDYVDSREKALHITYSYSADQLQIFWIEFYKSRHRRVNCPPPQSKNSTSTDLGIQLFNA